MTNQIEFSRQLIKGKVAEMIFEQMLREAGCFTVLAFGYENILPELMIRQRSVKAEQTMEIIRRAPDFAVINNETHDVSLIEIKYRSSLKSLDILSIAERMHDSWKPSHLFVATPKGFYYGKVSDVVKNNGKIASLSHPKIPQKLQDKYVVLLNEFIQKGSIPN